MSAGVGVRNSTISSPVYSYSLGLALGESCVALLNCFGVGGNGVLQMCTLSKLPNFDLKYCTNG